MKTVTIYLRSVEQEGKKRLAMFDSNGKGDIDNLTTEVEAGATVIWKLDNFIGIRNITRIYSKTGKRNVFKNDPAKRLVWKGFMLQLSKDAEGEEAYNIDYILCDDTKVTIDPYIRVPPPR